MQKFPILLISIAFVVGMSCALLCESQVWLWLMCGLLCFVFGVAMWVKKRGLRASGVVVVVLLAAVFFAGALRMQIRQQRLADTLKSLPWYEQVDFTAKVVALRPASDSSGLSFVKMSLLSSSPDLKIPLRYTFSAVLDSSAHIAFGDVLAARGRIVPLKAAQSPKETDYRSISLNKNTIGEFYISRVEKTGTFRLPLDQRIRSAIDSSLTRSGMGKSYAGFTLALVLGDKNGIDPNVKRYYQLSGVMHLLVVSGLHVGVVVAVFLFLTLPIKRKKILRAAMVITCVWGYAYVVGCSAPVSRAAMMFSVMMLSGVFTGRYTSVNALALSALVNLMIRPEDLLSVGFQMSYWATLVIILTAGIIYRRTVLWGAVWRFVGTLFGVSVAAQVALLPFMLYYFDYVNALSPVANIVLVPIVAYVLLPFGGLLCCLALMGIGIGFMIKAYQWLVDFSSGIAKYFAQSDGLAFEDMEFSFSGFVLMWVLVGGLVLLCKKRVEGVYVMLCAGIVACLWLAFGNGDVSYIAYGDKNVLFVSESKTQTIPPKSLVKIGEKKYGFGLSSDVVLVKEYFDLPSEVSEIVILPDAKVGDVLRWLEYSKKNNLKVYDMREKGFYVLD